MRQPESILKLINMFSRLPGVGAKSAARYAYFVLDMPKEEAEEFSKAIMEVKERVKLCKTCFCLSETETCPICLNRDKSIICVVSHPKDVLAIEKTGFKGVYHVLHGTLSPLDGRGPEQLKIKQLLSRLIDVNEVIIATNPDVEGEATAVYLARLIKPMGVKVTRPAQGVSFGSDLEYIDEATLIRALESRTAI